MNQLIELQPGAIAPASCPESLIIAVNFDGTICQYTDQAFPKIGAPVPHALTVLHRLREAGHRLMLWTMREGARLDEAARYLLDNGLSCWGWWSQLSPNSAHIYINDAALGCPLVHPSDGMAYIDWSEVERMLVERGILSDPLKASLDEQVGHIIPSNLTEMDDSQLMSLARAYLVNADIRKTGDKLAWLNEPFCFYGSDVWEQCEHLVLAEIKRRLEPRPRLEPFMIEQLAQK